MSTTHDDRIPGSGDSAAAAPAAARSRVARLDKLAMQAFVQRWHYTRSLDNVPAELAKAVWQAVKDDQARLGNPVTCSVMFPFVRSPWRIEALDLSDSGKWIVDSSLKALQYVATLRDVRLTACRFVTDDGLSFAPLLPTLNTLDVSWTQVSDSGVSSHITRCNASLTSLNLTGCSGLTDRGVASLLGLVYLKRLSLACTAITDAALDYLTYYTRYPDAGKAGLGVSFLERLELSNTRITDTGVGKLVAIMDEEGKPYGKVFKSLEYLALSMTNGVGPAAVRQVQKKYELDTPLPNAQRTLAKSNAVALDARDWVIRFNPTKDRQITAARRSWEQSRVLNYVAQYTKEMDAANAALARSGGLPPPPTHPGAPPPDAYDAAEADGAKRLRSA